MLNDGADVLAAPDGGRLAGGACVGTPGSARLRGEHDRVVDQPQVQHDTDQRPLRDAPQRGTLSSFEKSGEQLALLRGEDSRIAAVRAGLARLGVGEHPVLDPGGHHPGTGFHHAQSVCVGNQIRRSSLDPLGGPIPVHGAELTSRFEPRELHSAHVSHKAWGQQKLRPAPYPCQEHAVRGQPTHPLNGDRHVPPYAPPRPEAATCPPSSCPGPRAGGVLRRFRHFGRRAGPRAAPPGPHVRLFVLTWAPGRCGVLPRAAAPRRRLQVEVCSFELRRPRFSRGVGSSARTRRPSTRARRRAESVARPPGRRTAWRDGDSSPA